MGSLWWKQLPSISDVFGDVHKLRDAKGKRWVRNLLWTFLKTKEFVMICVTMGEGGPKNWKKSLYVIYGRLLYTEGRNYTKLKLKKNPYWSHHKSYNSLWFFKEVLYAIETNGILVWKFSLLSPKFKLTENYFADIALRRGKDGGSKVALRNL